MTARGWHSSTPSSRSGHSCGSGTVKPMSDASDCPFCERIKRGEVEHRYPDLHCDVVRFQPLNPVSPGHRLFVPIRHTEHPDWSAVSTAMGWAACWASGFPRDFNLITSSGPAASQTVRHIHIHYVPRSPGDGLHLPWTPIVAEVAE